MKTKSMRDKSRFSPLEQAQSLKQGCEVSRKNRPELGLALPLTSLIDAFSIIVIYLLIGTQTSGPEMGVPSRIKLPVAEAGVTVEKETPIVRIEQGQYFINDTKVGLQNLGSALARLKKDSASEMEIVIQADQKMDYADLDPLLRAGSEAGIQKLKFAVMAKK